MKKTAIAITAGVLAVTGVLYALTFLDINAYRADVSALIEEQTGRQLVLDGPLEVGFSLTPTVVAKDVRFGNAAWGSEPFMLEAEEVAITLSLLGLITGDFSISRVAAQNSILLLEANTAGTMNWELDVEAPSLDADTPSHSKISLPDIELTNTTITYRSQRIDRVFHISLSNFSVADGFFGIAIDADGKIDGQPVSLVGTFAGRPSDFEITDIALEFGDLVIEGTGSAKRVQGGGPYHVAAAVSANRTDITSWLEWTLAGGGTGVDIAERNRVDFMDQPLELSFLDVATVDLFIEIGRLDIRGAELRNVEVKLQTTTSAAMLELATSYDAKNVRVTGRLDRGDVPKAEMSISFDELDLEKITDDAEYPIDLAAGARASGKAELAARGKTARAVLASLTGTIDGHLELGTVDLTPMAAAPVEEGADSGASNESLFSSEELPLDFVDGFTGSINTKIDRVVYGDLVVSDIRVPITFRNKEIGATLEAHYHDRQVRFSHTAHLGASPSFDFNLIADDFDLGRLLAELNISDLAESRADFALNGSVAGRSPEALASSFTGAMNLVAGEGEIASSVFELIAADLVWALVPKGGDAGRAKLTCALSRIDFVDGVGTMSAFALVTQRMRTSGAGTINLQDETLDLTFYPKPNDTSLLSLSTPIRVSGSLTGPRVRPDTASFLLDAAKIVGAGVLTGGIGAVLPLMNLQNFDAEDAGACLNMLKDGDQGAGGINETIGSGANAVTEGAGSIVKGVGDILISPFKRD